MEAIKRVLPAENGCKDIELTFPALYGYDLADEVAVTRDEVAAPRDLDGRVS